MNRKTSIILSIGMSVAFIAFGVWFLYSHNMANWPQNALCTYGQHGMMGGGMGIIMIVFWLLLIAAFVLLISGAIDGARGTKDKKENELNPLNTLKLRYARGEIDKDEYKQKLRDLKD